jgi:hypothetical protein
MEIRWEQARQTRDQRRGVAWIGDTANGLIEVTHDRRVTYILSGGGTLALVASDRDAILASLEAWLPSQGPAAPTDRGSA